MCHKPINPSKCCNITFTLLFTNSWSTPIEVWPDDGAIYLDWNHNIDGRRFEKGRDETSADIPIDLKSKDFQVSIDTSLVQQIYLILY